MALIKLEKWTPVGVDSLEHSASQVVRSESNSIVTAGPGAGKTELLAQRACYLLDTGVCKPPRRILAISFKRDAAKNLAERVKRRCGERADRFDSFTLDAFAKSIVDRFRLGLPEDWRPESDYTVLANGLPVDAIRIWLTSRGVSESFVSSQNNNQIRAHFDPIMHGYSLPYDDPDITSRIKELGIQWWQEQLALPREIPSLTFPMLNRLAAFLLRQNPAILTALRATYQFVFLDEFQDTTASQYDLIHAAFYGSESTMTAVGDNKQQIMLWAGAMSNAFDKFAGDFSATRCELLRNYRSAPKLVEMQHVIAKAMESGAHPAIAAKKGVAGSCSVLEFDDYEAEARHVATMIEEAIHNEGASPRDFCIIVRQRTSDMIAPLQDQLLGMGIKLRDESILQDILTEPVVGFILAILRLATRKRDPEAWTLLTSEIAALFGWGDDEDSSKINQKAKELIDLVISSDKLSVTPSEIISLIGEDIFRSRYRQYARGSFFEKVIKDFSDILEQYAGQTEAETVNNVIGDDIVPAMTIHKSKGLEFSTVIFLGLEDSQWWNFSNQSEEEIRSFFVAFSRAIEKVYFTYSNVRLTRFGERRQNRTAIHDLYSILQDAGVPTIPCRS